MLFLIENSLRLLCISSLERLVLEESKAANYRGSGLLLRKMDLSRSIWGFWFQIKAYDLFRSFKVTNRLIRFAV